MIDKVTQLGAINSRLGRYSIANDITTRLRLNRTVKQANAVCFNVRKVNDTWVHEGFVAREYRPDLQQAFLFRTDNGGANAVPPFPTLRMNDLKESQITPCKQRLDMLTKLQKKLTRIANSSTDELQSIIQTAVTWIEQEKGNNTPSMIQFCELLQTDKGSINLFSFQINDHIDHAMNCENVAFQFISCSSSFLWAMMSVFL